MTAGLARITLTVFMGPRFRGDDGNALHYFGSIV
jgi:hypothetical protein